MPPARNFYAHVRILVSDPPSSQLVSLLCVSVAFVPSAREVDERKAAPTVQSTPKRARDDMADIPAESNVLEQGRASKVGFFSMPPRSRIHFRWSVSLQALFKTPAAMSDGGAGCRIVSRNQSATPKYTSVCMWP